MAFTRVRCEPLRPAMTSVLLDLAGLVHAFPIENDDGTYHYALLGTGGVLTELLTLNADPNFRAFDEYVNAGNEWQATHEANAGGAVFGRVKAIANAATDTATVTTTVENAAGANATVVVGSSFLSETYSDASGSSQVFLSPADYQASASGATAGNAQLQASETTDNKQVSWKAECFAAFDNPQVVAVVDVPLDGVFAFRAFSIVGVKGVITNGTAYYGREQASTPDMGNIAFMGAPDYAIFARQNGGGKTELCVKFTGGSAIVLATEP